MFTTTLNAYSIEEWITENIHDDEMITWFKSFSLNTNVVNTLLVSHGDIIHLLFRMPDNQYRALTSDEEKTIVKYVLSIAKVYPFPNIKDVIENIKAFLRKVEVAPNISYNDIARLLPILLN